MKSGSIRETTRNRRLWRRAAALFLAAAGVWMLVGCIFLPTPESPTVAGQVDFRPILKRRPLARGMTRAQIVALLGAPNRSSINDQTVVYVYESSSGLWVTPLCGNRSNEYKQLALGLLFDADGHLLDWDLAEEKEFEGPIPLPSPPWRDPVFDLKPSIWGKLHAPRP